MVGLPLRRFVVTERCHDRTTYATNDFNDHVMNFRKYRTLAYSPANVFCRRTAGVAGRYSVARDGALVRFAMATLAGDPAGSGWPGKLPRYVGYVTERETRPGMVLKRANRRGVGGTNTMKRHVYPPW
jgi:hypothetical protein